MISRAIVIRPLLPSSRKFSYTIVVILLSSSLLLVLFSLSGCTKQPGLPKPVEERIWVFDKYDNAAYITREYEEESRFYMWTLDLFEQAEVGVHYQCEKGGLSENYPPSLSSKNCLASDSPTPTRTPAFRAIAQLCAKHSAFMVTQDTEITVFLDDAIKMIPAERDYLVWATGLAFGTPHATLATKAHDSSAQEPQLATNLIEIGENKFSFEVFTIIDKEYAGMWRIDFRLLPNKNSYTYDVLEEIGT